MNLDLSSGFSRLDQIQYLESEVRRLQFISSPTKNKKIAMIENIIVELRKLSEPSYPSKLICAKLDFVFDNAIVSAGWYVTDQNQDFDSCLDGYIKTHQNKNRRYIRSESFIVTPKLELFKIGANVLVYGMALIKSNIRDYIYGEIDPDVLKKHDKSLLTVAQAIEENNFMAGLSRDIGNTELLELMYPDQLKPQVSMTILKQRDPTCTPKLELYTDFQSLKEVTQDANGSK